MSFTKFSLALIAASVLATSALANPITVDAQGLQTLVIPAWPEPARVIEDCRS